MENSMKYLETSKAKFPFTYTLNVMEAIQEKYGSLQAWSDLIESKTNPEPDIKALIFFFTEAINEGIEIENEEKGEKRELVTPKQVGRIITEIGIIDAGQKLKNAVIDSSKISDDSNESDEVEQEKN